MLRRVSASVKLGAILAVTAVAAAPTGAGAVATPPSVRQFDKTAIAVIPGTKVAVHWSRAANEDFLLTSTPPTSLPHFGSKTGTTWPTGSNAAFSAKYQCCLLYTSRCV